MVAAGVIRTNTKWVFEQRLLQIAGGLRKLIGEHAPQSAAVEGIFYSANVKTALKLAHVRGVALLTIAEAGIGLGEYSPLEVKISVVGYGRAEKSQVQMMIRSILRLREALFAYPREGGTALERTRPEDVKTLEKALEFLKRVLQGREEVLALDPQGQRLVTDDNMGTEWGEGP
jgi:crossover junction endodeoxyribonuclease RuvC